MLLCELRGRASSSPRQPAQHLYGCLLQHAFSLCFLFSWYPCLHFLQPIHFNDESAQFLGGDGRRKDLCYIRKSYSRQVDTHPAVSVKGHHSVNLVRPSWRRLAINFDLPANVRLFCTLGHKVWLTFDLRWLPVRRLLHLAPIQDHRVSAELRGTQVVSLLQSSDMVLLHSWKKRMNLGWCLNPGGLNPQ